MISEIIKCANCGANNRVKADADAKAICGRCKTPLQKNVKPLIVTDANFSSAVENSPLPVLLDFWATWCPPCRDEVPELVSLHRAYNRSGFEIVGVSLDREATALSSYTRSNGMKWRQIFGKQARTIATTYGVSGIPFNVVIGRDGRAVAIDVHGDTLNRVIAAALAERN